MALGKCPECAGAVSTTATSCPHCGNTKFQVPSGRFVKQRCRQCLGAKYNPVDYGGKGEACPKCSGTGEQPVAEVKDLRDGSLHVPPDVWGHGGC
jgi:Zn finger protein HypA/HybF involved in hydrogenase expression